MSDKVYIVAPGNYTTGGPELCHQLAHHLNQAGTDRARVVYTPFDRVYTVPEAYRHYDVRPARSRFIEPGSIVVLPEIYGDYLGWFNECTIYYWWMSVGNFLTAAGPRAHAQLDAMENRVAMHLYQSEHARRWLDTMKLGPSVRLSDYISDGYIKAIADPPGWDREDVVVYNPAKGEERTESILAELDRRNSGYRAVPLQGLDTTGVRRLLGRAKLYIDFGEHPGKDRIPREAAAMGCCVLTNRRGSAGSNPDDVPIPGDLKVNDRKPGFERRAVRKIETLLESFDDEQPRLHSYRERIAMEPELFGLDADALFGREAA